MNPNSCSLNTSSCTLFLSLALLSQFFQTFHLVGFIFLLSSPYSFFPAMYRLVGFMDILAPIKHLSCHFSIIKVDFWGVFIVQASHLSFNEANIRQQHLINAEVTIMLDSMQYSACYSGMETEVASLVNLLISSWLGYHISG